MQQCNVCKKKMTAPFRKQAALHARLYELISLGVFCTPCSAGPLMMVSMYFRSTDLNVHCSSEQPWLRPWTKKKCLFNKRSDFLINGDKFHCLGTPIQLLWWNSNDYNVPLKWLPIGIFTCKVQSNTPCTHLHRAKPHIITVVFFMSTTKIFRQLMHWVWSMWRQNDIC